MDWSALMLVMGGLSIMTGYYVICSRNIGQGRYRRRSDVDNSDNS